MDIEQKKLKAARAVIGGMSMPKAPKHYGLTYETVRWAVNKEKKRQNIQKNHPGWAEECEDVPEPQRYVPVARMGCC